jgi:hypothetical protein
MPVRFLPPSSCVVSCTLFGCAAAFAACSPEDRGAAPRTEYVETTTLGATCGEWQTTETGAVPRVRRNVACGPGLECDGWVLAYPTNQMGNHFGICLPVGGQACAADSTCLDPGLTCLAGVAAPFPTGACWFRCASHQDCPGPFQVCSTGGCQFNVCSEPGVTPVVSCGVGAHCERSICVPDAATN